MHGTTGWRDKNFSPARQAKKVKNSKCRNSITAVHPQQAVRSLTKEIQCCQLLHILMLPATKRLDVADSEADFIFTPPRRMSIIESPPLNGSESSSAYTIDFPPRTNSSTRQSSSSEQHASANKFLASTSETTAFISLAKESKPRRKSGSEKLRNFPQRQAEKFSSSKVKNVQAFSLGNIFPSILRARKIF